MGTVAAIGTDNARRPDGEVHDRRLAARDRGRLTVLRRGDGVGRLARPGAVAINGESPVVSRARATTRGVPGKAVGAGGVGGRAAQIAARQYGADPWLPVRELRDGAFDVAGKAVKLDAEPTAAGCASVPVDRAVGAVDVRGSQIASGGPRELPVTRRERYRNASPRSRASLVRDPAVARMNTWVVFGWWVRSIAPEDGTGDDVGVQISRLSQRAAPEKSKSDGGGKKSGRMRHDTDKAKLSEERIHRPPLSGESDRLSSAL